MVSCFSRFMSMSWWAYFQPRVFRSFVMSSNVILDNFLVLCAENRRTNLFLHLCNPAASTILFGLSLSVLSQAVLLSSAETQHTLTLWPNLTKVQHAIWEKDKTVHSSSGGKVIWFQGIRKSKGNRNQTWAGHFRTERNLLGLSSLQQDSGQRRVPLTMYSPQSLHRWGITHSESMERLAYSQGRLAKCYSWSHTLFTVP